ncbi:dUTP diphosphatase [Spiroplasma endosymbiont of Nebria brevicollis]|uniref:dUTP diphosphatase n=1 Tax=Spiroplasma endosymbiont of Nebria brevicollis TaxID=3066284 RepID=UPI00313F2347
MLNQEQFTTIINLQRALDNKIITTRSVSESSTLTARFLALLVELAEFANEQRCFKYWSLKPSSAKNVMLEEYIDGLHFIISIANSLNIDFKKYHFIEQDNESELTLLFINLFASVTTFFTSKTNEDFYQLLNFYFSIAKRCEFTNNDIITSYLTKNKINHLRQSQNY